VSKVIILKNDRTGDLFTSIPTINLIFNKHKNNQIEIFLSKINYKFSFLFKPNKIKVINLNLNLMDKLSILFYLLINKIDSVYILSPKNFYFYIPVILFFKKIKFYGLCIDSDKYRPSLFLRKFLFKKVIINRKEIKKRNSTYNIQKCLIDNNINDIKDLIKSNLEADLKIDIPENSIFFHYKHKMFNDLMNWDLNKVKKFIEFISKKKGNVIFSSEINNKLSDDFFSKNFNSYDFKNNISENKNSKNILFLKNVDGLNLYTAIKKSSEIIAPEGIVTHIGYRLNKKILSLMFFKLRDRKDFINQIISCKEWFPPNNFKYIVLKKEFDACLLKLSKRL
tara:strand:+ start:996 stop:2009 length:1014 start_codon:yes stop_codon:yes gene_type:complete